MSRQTVKETAATIARLVKAGISENDAWALRRIAMTLARWHEQECGDSNDHCSWSIERDGDEPDSKPYRVTHPHNGGKSIRTAIADRENGALRRLAALMTSYPTLTSYVQGDPRGAALFILRPGDLPPGGRIDEWYSRGVAVY